MVKKKTEDARRVCVVHLTPVYGSLQASARLARFLSEELQAPLIDDAETMYTFLTAAGHNLGNIGTRDITCVMANGPIAFCGFRDEMGGHLLPNVERLVWVQQDYTITMPPHQSYSRPTVAETPFRKEFFSIPKVSLWSSCQDVLAKRQNKWPHTQHQDDEYVDWNALTYAPMGLGTEQLHSGVINEVFYYGALRAGRMQAISRFLGGMKQCACTVSVSNPRANVMQEWRTITCDIPNFVHPAKDPDVKYATRNGNRYGVSALVPMIARFKHSLYIGDDDSNRNFHSLANRFYEVLSTPDTVLWLDAAGYATYMAAGLRGWEEFAVENGAALQDKLAIRESTRKRLAAKQRSRWFITDPYDALVAQVNVLSQYHRI